MDTHKNSPLMPKGRKAMVRSVIEGGLTKAATALQFSGTARHPGKHRGYRLGWIPSQAPRREPAGSSAPFDRRRRIRLTVAGETPTNNSCYNPSPSAKPAGPSASSTSAPSPMLRRPMARSSASPRPICVNGLTPVLTTGEPLNCRDGFTATIGTDRTAVSARCFTSIDSPDQEPVEAP